ncbi:MULTISPECIES: nSTAND3 domain-containing NTPase [Chitinophagaceae]
MTGYDFLVLSPHEFENISRDLLQKKLSVFIESFTTGRDGGIDLRYAKGKNENTIIQAKRYKDYTSLFNHLKGEVSKVRKLAPDSYVITTSVGLTPANKDAIKDLFHPFIQDTSDILGKDDLNNLLSIHKDIESKYYKLWLSSTNILEKVLHSKIYNQSAFELEEIREQVKLYVQNESFNKALDILKNNRYVIISGIPGIGKTTLSRILILFLLSNGFDEFVYLNQSIDDGYEFFADGKKQVFFFDDFLGKNFFEKKHSANEDNKIVKFIEKIKRSPDKVLILATREYILNQAKNAFEAFKINDIEIAKCVLDLSSYTNLIKAQIIYNHLYFADVPVGHLEDLVAEIKGDWLKRKKYSQLINHPNYNPRIIETIVQRKIWEHCQANQFATAFKSFLDNPESVWLYAFENSLDKFSQYALIVLLSMGTPVTIGDWEKALKEFLVVNAYKFQINYDSIIFERALRELENTFIKTQKDSYSTIVVEYQNPSIQDFLVNYLKGKNDLIGSILDAALFTNQFFTVFITIATDDTKHNRKILLDKDSIEIAATRLIKVFSELRSCRATKHVYRRNDSTYFWDSTSNYKYEFLKTVYTEIGSHNKLVSDLVHNQFQKHIYIDDFSYSEHQSYIDLLQNLDKSKLTFEEEKLLEFQLEKITWLDNLELFSKLENIFPTTYEKVTAEQAFVDRVGEIVAEEMSSVDDSDLESFKNQVEDISSLYDLSLAEELEELETRWKDYAARLDFEAESYIEDRTRDADERNEMSEDRVIEEIFNSLVDR